MTNNTMVLEVAKYFVEVMEDEGFDSFAEMRQCYMWETQDIKEEVLAICDEHVEIGFMHDDMDYVTCYIDGSEELIEYRKFMNVVYKTIREIRK